MTDKIKQSFPFLQSLHEEGYAQMDRFRGSWDPGPESVDFFRFKEDDLDQGFLVHTVSVCMRLNSGRLWRSVEPPAGFSSVLLDF